MTRLQAIAGLDAAGYQRHALHCPEQRDWPEKNCYSDLWIELLHGLKLDPMAMLGNTVAVDFLGDQWTFFKPTGSELRELYGIDVQELTVWRPLEDHVVEHLGSGRLVAAEVDAFWLPDTAATDYRQNHSKTTVVFADVDPGRRTAGYFHNAGYFELQGEDYAGAMRAVDTTGPAALPLFAEVIRIDRRERRPDAELAETALGLLRHHHHWKPLTNPFTRFAPRLQQEVEQLGEHGMGYYHLWAFGSVRQAGAAFELVAAHLDWLASCGHDVGSAEPFRTISTTCKSLILKGARTAATRRVFDTAPASDKMSRAWDEGMESIEAALMQVEW